jgi:hypothetical protein
MSRIHRTRRLLGGGVRGTWRRLWERRRLRNRVIKGLELAPRGAVANDRLRLRQASVSLSVEWQARDIHPWDGDVPLEQQMAGITRELMTDTLVAIRQLFDGNRMSE